MKILQVMAGAATGGAENIFLESVLALEEAGAQQCIITRDNNTFRLRSFKERGIPTVTTSFSKLWPFPARAIMVSAIETFQPDVIQYWMEHAGTFAPAATRERNIGWYDGHHKVESFANCDYHIGLSKDITHHIYEQGVEKSSLGLIHPYAEFPFAEPTPRHLFDTPEDAPLLLTLARLNWNKGLDTLLNAMGQVPGAYLWMAGDGPLREELETQARFLNITDRVRFIGWRDDRGSLLAACDIVVSPSRYEAFSAAMVDAWASKRPLIAAASAGSKTYVQNEENGLLIEVDDTDALAATIRRLIDEPDLAQKIVEGGKRAYEAQFTKEIFMRESRAFYEKVAAKAPPQISA